MVQSILSITYVMLFIHPFYIACSPCQGSPNEPAKLLLPPDDPQVHERVRTNPRSRLAPTDSPAATTENAKVSYIARLSREIEGGGEGRGLYIQCVCGKCPNWKLGFFVIKQSCFRCF